jgi:hypothetical protein
MDSAISRRLEGGPIAGLMDLSDIFDQKKAGLNGRPFILLVEISTCQQPDRPSDNLSVL